MSSFSTHHHQRPLQLSRENTEFTHPGKEGRCLEHKTRSCYAPGTKTLRPTGRLAFYNQCNNLRPTFPPNMSGRAAEKRCPFNKTLSTYIVHKLQCIIITFFSSLNSEPDYKVRKNTETATMFPIIRTRSFFRQMISHII